MVLKDRFVKSGYAFNRMEFSGGLGDLGTLLPLSVGMILVNGLSPVGVFFSIGLFYILSGIYYGITVPVQPMKVIGAYAIAMTLSASQIAASGLLVGLFLLVIGGTGAIGLLGKYIPKSVIRGVQMSTGALLMAQGAKFVAGTSTFQLLHGAAEPYLNLQSIGFLPIGLFLGILGSIMTLFFLDNKKLPAGLLVILSGVAFGLIWGTHEGFANLMPGIYLPSLLPLGFPTGGNPPVSRGRGAGSPLQVWCPHSRVQYHDRPDFCGPGDLFGDTQPCHYLSDPFFRAGHTSDICRQPAGPYRH